MKKLLIMKFHMHHLVLLKFIEAVYNYTILEYKHDTHHNRLQSLVFDVVSEMELVLYQTPNLMFLLKAMIFP